MIALKTFGPDNNPNANSNYVGIPVPVGVSDGDLLIVGITVPSSGITITPPDGWTLIGRTDPAAAIGVAAYYKYATNEGARWVFETSASTKCPATVAVYSGADGFRPVDATAVSVNGAHAYTTVADVTASLPFVQRLYVLAAAAAGAYTPASGTRTVQNRQLGSYTAEIQDRMLTADGVSAGSNVTFASSVVGASIAICLAPSPGLQSLDDVYARLIGAFPIGADEVYDLTSSGDYYKYFRVLASTLKAAGYDIVDLLRQETVPGQTRYKLPDWERAFGLETSKTAKLGTIPQRQAQVVAAWRAAAGQACSIPEIQAVIGPLLGYADPSTLVIVETDRAALKTLHTYAPTVAVPITAPLSTTTLVHFYVGDDAKVSAAGAQIIANVTHPSMENISVSLAGPDSTGGAVDPTTYVYSPIDGIAYKSWGYAPLGEGNVTAQDRILYAKEAAGCWVRGIWTLAIVNADVADDLTLTTVGIFVEGLGRDSAGGDGLGSAIYEWGVYADPALMGATTAADFDAARAMLTRMAQAHTRAHLIQSLAPYPDVTSGLHAAIPDEAVPV